MRCVLLGSLFDSSEQNAAEHTIDGSGGRLLGNCWAMEHISDPNDEMQSSGTVPPLSRCCQVRLTCSIWFRDDHYRSGASGHSG